MSLAITLPLTDRQAQAVVVAADSFGVEPWEMGVHVLWTTHIGNRLQAPHIGRTGESA